jgi:alkylhydroperoxidase family enzyme
VSEHLDALRAVVDRYPADPRLSSYLAKVHGEAHKVTDRDVQELKDAGVSEDEIFEQTVAAAISEGLRRFDAADAVIG